MKFFPEKICQTLTASFYSLRRNPLLLIEIADHPNDNKKPLTSSGMFLLLLFFSLCFSFCATEEKIQKSEPPRTVESREVEVIEPPVIVEKKPPLFYLNRKDTLQVSACSCKAFLLNNEDRNIAGKLVNIFTKEADREFKLVCSGTVQNKTKFKLTEMKVVFHLMSETEYPLYDSEPAEYRDNYILPGKKAKFSMDVLYDRGLSIFMKKVKKTNCEVASVKDVSSGEILTE